MPGLPASGSLGPRTAGRAESAYKRFAQQNLGARAISFRPRRLNPPGSPRGLPRGAAQKQLDELHIAITERENEDA